MPNTDRKFLIDHISRLEGQLASIKKELQAESSDCLKAATTLRAASRSFASLKHAFVSCFLQKKFFTKQQGASLQDSPEYDALLDLIRS
jgi:DNA-binding FrmR family transcriptional regulator